MKRLLYSILAVALISTTINAQNVGVGIATPNASAKLHIEDANRGLMIPRVSLTNVTNGTTPVNAPLTGLLVFNTNAGVTGGSGTGFYYWTGAQWSKLMDTQSNDWTLLGNSGTNPATNFVGTIDNQSFVVRTNNTERMRVLNTGNVGVGDATPLALFTVGNGDLMRVESTGHIRTINGTVAAPSFSFTGDNNTGFFHTALADDIGIATGGLLRLWISDAGETYVGANAPILPGDLFCATASNTNAVTSGSGALTWAVNGYTAYNGGAVYGLRLTGATGTWGALQGETSATNPANSPGVNGTVSAASHIGVRGYHPAGSGWGGIFYNDLGYTGGLFNASDRSLKKNIQNFNGAISIISQIPIYSYEYKTDEYDVLGSIGETHYGVMADELKSILPDLVKTKSLGGLACRNCEEEIKDVKNNVELVNYMELIPIAVQAIKEQQQIIEAQNAKIQKLEEAVDALKNK